MGSQSINVTRRGNDGSKSERTVEDLPEAERIAKELRTVQNHMVCIVVDGQRQKRWDRNKIVGENRWRVVDVNAFETLGPIREVVAVRR